MRERVLGRLGILGAAAVGVIVGHCLTYVLAVWDRESRHAVMMETGHGYWDMALGTAIVLGIWLAGAVIFRHLRPGAAPSAPVEIRPLAIRLAALQVGLFTAVEVGERLVASVPLEASLLQELLSFGAAVQAFVALAIALLLRLLVRAAEVLAAVLRPPLPASSAPPRRPPLRHRPRRVAVLAGGGGVRGPPALRYARI
jgi:hypothetical protein